MNRWVPVLLLAVAAWGQEARPARDWASLVGQRFRAERDVVYKSVGGFQARLDLYVRYDAKPGPAVLYIHGGGWANGSKEQYILWYLPYFELGMRVVSVQYRLSGAAAAPAAVEDCRCALKWVLANAGKYGIDPDRLVVTGGSAGGHLALITGMLDPSAGFDGDCPGEQKHKPAAIINYYGVTDVVDSLDRKSKSALVWLRGLEDPREMARRLSPLTYVRAGLPPVLTIHGDADEAVPYDHAVRLHKALDAAGVANRLVTIPGGRHGRFQWSDQETLRVQRAIEAFLGERRLVERD